MFDNERRMGNTYIIVRVCNRTQIIIGGIMNLSEQIEQMLQEPIREFREIVIPLIKKLVNTEVEHVQYFEGDGEYNAQFCLYDKDGKLLIKTETLSDPNHQEMDAIYNKAEKIIENKYGGFVSFEVINRAI